MTANLLAHSDIFRAGIARSGAYNRTLTPFGFQNEQRTFWEVPEIYLNGCRRSTFANKINEPILLIHGEADDNTRHVPDPVGALLHGTQGSRRHRALRDAAARSARLPARESVLHTVAEMLNWSNEFVKNAKPRTGTTTQQQQQ